jgi:hypothetical protein
MYLIAAFSTTHSGYTQILAYRIPTINAMPYISHGNANPK